MSDQHLRHTDPSASTGASGKLAIVLAEFATPADLVGAAKKVRDAGYQLFDSHSPFPIHGIDEAMGIRRTKLPFISLTMGALGIVTALSMQWWMNGIDYKFWISGKPFISVPSSVPVGFELMVLFAAFSTLFGMLLLNGLPRFVNPISFSERFLRATDDKFFLTIQGRDKKCAPGTTVEFLRSLGADFVEECWSKPATPIPRNVWLGIITVALIALCPVFMIAKWRVIEKREPRFHVIFDMDFQTKFKPQKKSSLFADGRASRPQVTGTVLRGQLNDDVKLYKGINPQDSGLQTALISLKQITPATPTSGAVGTPASVDGGAVIPNDPLDQIPWTTTFPIPVNAQTMARGQERYNIYCSMCHGLAGDGDGLVTQRAIELEQPTWVRPVSFHSEAIQNQPVGRLFHSITNGVRKMPGYGDQIPTEDRWAIILYLRALQKGRNAKLDDVPADLRDALKDL
jgi:mono/diheme cytochrome c family protein